MFTTEFCQQIFLVSLIGGAIETFALMTLDLMAQKIPKVKFSTI
jgi:hypothetical protein